MGHTGSGMHDIALHFKVVWSGPRRRPHLTAKGNECYPSMCPEGKGNESGDHTAFCFCHR